MWKGKIENAAGKEKFNVKEGHRMLMHIYRNWNGMVITHTAIQKSTSSA